MLTELVADLLDAPDAQLIIDRVQAVLNDEKKRRQEFYEWLQDDIKAEFINGQVVMHSPVRRKHLRASKLLANLLHNFVVAHNLGEVDTEKALVTLTRNDYEPDICFWRREVADTFDDETMQHPAPDLVVEVLSKGTAKRDRGIKFEDYASHGVREYWLIDPTRQTIEQYRLDNEFMAFDQAGNFHLTDSISAYTIPGFTIPVRAVFDKETNQEVLQRLLAEH
ncbi:Uma2 family endonuclease [Spirosoma sp. KUDC1026]|uniref:Uma2 family endonuclease n=1 Tax=Spirosoma sp. KUDC1026 TaxID=2745947 RepID=UPI00159BD3FF|nr:Uma2 family endonuclease [Spirosoma sp. KUDC1026]QKZ12324.1 Uma2 family endonuclease [Spirosoma sp. KUDC1026]